MKRRVFVYKSIGWLAGSLAAVSLSGFTGIQGDEKPKKSEDVYTVLKVRCNGCKRCMMPCKEKAISIVEGKAQIDSDKCQGCGDCVHSCKRQAIKLDDSKKTSEANK